VKLDCSASGNQVNDQNHDGDHQQKVDEAACYVEAEAEKPQNQKNDDNRPEHVFLLVWLRAFDGEVREEFYVLVPIARGGGAHFATGERTGGMVAIVTLN
jgi:hypothetical protein